jgi:hypothetical protein
MDALFAATFFATRIVFHVHLGCTFALRALARGSSWVPAVVLACALPMHVLWMRDCLRGILKRRRLANAQANAVGALALPPTTTTTVATPVSAPLLLPLPGLALVRGLRAVRGRVRAARTRYAQARPGQAALRLVRRALAQQLQLQVDASSAASPPPSPSLDTSVAAAAMASGTDVTVSAFRRREAGVLL